MRPSFYDSYLSLRETLSLNLLILFSLKNCAKNAILFKWASNCQYFRGHIYLKDCNLMHLRHFCDETSFHQLPKLFHFLIFKTHLNALFFISKWSDEASVLRLFPFPFYKWQPISVAASVRRIKYGCVSHQISNFLHF